MMSASFDALFLSSVEHVLQTREEAKPRKQQTTQAIVSADLLQRASTARLARVAQAEECQQLVKTLRRFMPTRQADECLLAASVASQVEVDSLPVEPGSVCIFSGLDTDLITVRLYGDHDPASGEVGRAESAFVINGKHSWRWWIEAVLVSCNTIEWLDKQVSLWLDHPDVKATLKFGGTQVTQATLDLAPPRLLVNAPRALALAVEFVKTHLV